MLLQRYEELVHRFAGRRMVVFGDLMLDEYLVGQATRISPEGPVMIISVEREASVPGGAANVVNNLLALGAQVSVVGVVGEDTAGQTLREAMQARGADVRGVLTDPARATTRKTRVIAHSQQVLRIDREQTDPVGEALQRRLLAALEKELARAHCMIVSDYNKGVVTASLTQEAARSARRAETLVTANAKPGSARLLAQANILSLNLSEAHQTLGDDRILTEEGLERAGKMLRRELDVEHFVLTRGAKGLSIFSTGDRVLHIPAHKVDVYDVAGAGDTVISVLSLGIAAGAELEEAAILANHAAACVVRKVGVATVSGDELLMDWRRVTAVDES